MHSWLSQLGPPPISLRWAEGSKLLWDLSVARRLRLLVTWTKCTGVQSITLCGGVCIRLSYHYFLRAVPARVVSQAMLFILAVLPCELYELCVGGGEPPSHPSMGQHSCAKVFGSMDPTKAPLGQIYIYIYTPMAVGTYRPLRRSTMPVWTAWAAIRNVMAHDGPEGGRVVVKVPPPCPPFITS